MNLFLLPFYITLSGFNNLHPSPSATIMAPLAGFSVFNFPFSIFHFSFSVFNFSFSVFRFPFSVFNFSFFVSRFQFSVFNFSFFVLRFQFPVFNFSFFVFRFPFSVFHFPFSIFNCPSSIPPSPFSLPPSPLFNGPRFYDFTLRRDPDGVGGPRRGGGTPTGWGWDEAELLPLRS